MGWTKHYRSDDGSGASFKAGIDNKDGSYRHERISTDSGDSGHYHDIQKSTGDGQTKEIRSEKRGS